MPLQEKHFLRANLSPEDAATAESVWLRAGLQALNNADCASPEEASEAACWCADLFVVEWDARFHTISWLDESVLADDEQDEASDEPYRDDLLIERDERARRTRQRRRGR